MATVLVAVAPSVLATKPAQGQLSQDQREVSFGGGPYFLSNPLTGLPGMCQVESLCDEFRLQVDLPAVLNEPDLQVALELSWPGLESDFDVFVYAASGAEVASAATFANPERVFFPAEPGKRDYRVVIVPYRVLGTRVAGLVRLQGGQQDVVPDQGPAMRFFVHAPPDDARRLGWSAGEPSIGLSPHEPRALVQAGLETIHVEFDDRTSPARTDWRDVSPLLGALITLDPVLEVDPGTGRVFTSQLLGFTSLFAYSDDFGASWQQAQIAPPNGGFDHQGIGAGPYPPDSPFAILEPLRGYPHAVYFCSQAVATAFCARSDDGGLTFGPGVPIFAPGECAGFHGKPKVDSAGVVYLPIKECGGSQAVIVSEDAGLSWETRPLPGSTVSQIDPFIALPPWDRDAPGVLYVAYVNADGRLQVAVSQDGARSFERSVELGGERGLRNAVFPVAAAGDVDRAAIGFVATSEPGNFEAADFPGIWHLYVASTLDAGRTWGLTNVTPNDPVQAAGGICISGVACAAAQNRNLLEFNDMVADAQGRVHLVFADGCVDNCVLGGTNTFSSRLRIARQTGGPRLHAAFDPVTPRRPEAVRLNAQRYRGTAYLDWARPDAGGQPITGFRIYRGQPGAPLARIAEIGPHLSYEDRGLDPSIVEYRYVVTALNASGEGLRAPPLAVPVTAARQIRNRCFVPGERLFEDARGDTTFLHPSLDLLEVYVAEPDVGTQPVVLSLRVEDLSQRLPGSLWRVSWAEGVDDRRFVRARIGPDGREIFEYGRGSAFNEEIQGRLAPGSAIRPDENLISLVVSRDRLNLPPDMGSLDAIGVRVGIDPSADFLQSIGQLSSDDAADGPGRTLGQIALRGASNCDPAATPSRQLPAHAPRKDSDQRGGAFAGWCLLSLLIAAIFNRYSRRSNPASPVPAAARPWP